jgi:23S rRNA pseudouridine2605 synthase
MTTDSLPMPDAQDSAPALDEAAKPKRTRRAKPAEVADVTSAEVVASSGQAEEDGAPKRAPRRRKPVEVSDAALALEVEAAAPAARKRAPRRKVAVESGEAGEDVGNQAPGESAPGEPVLPVQVAVEGLRTAGADGDAGESRELRGERRDRRDRRRNRPLRSEADHSSGVEGGNASEVVAVGLEDGAEAEGTELRLNRRTAMAEQQASEVFAELLSGEFDKVHEEETEGDEGESTGAYKRVLRPEPDAPKLQKVLAQSGVGSRRDIEKMIEDGRIEVNDQVAHIGQRISHGDRVKVAGKPIKVRIAPQPARILAYHKPVGEVVTHDDPQGRPTVFRRLPRLQHGKWMSVGRLDLNTEGLLLFTNSGELANQLMHPRFGVEREYAVRVLGSLDEASRERLLTGVEIEGQAAAFLSVSKGLGEGVNQWYRVVITEGRNREVRKLFDAVGLTVNRLIRVRYGAIVLPRGLRRGVWVELGESDVRAVKSLAGMNRQDEGRGGNGDSKGRPQGQGQHREQQGLRGGQQGGQHPQQGQQGQRGGKQGRGNGPSQGGRPQGQGAHGGQQGQRPQRSHGVDRVQQGPQDHDEDDHFGPIPNPLEQTFDRRFVKSGSKRITSGFGRPDQDQGGQQGGKQQKGPRQPDPMQTSVGYIGADAYFGGGRNNRGGGGGGGGGGRRGRR